MKVMRHISIICLTLCLSSAPALTQEATPDDYSEELEEFSESAREFFQGWMGMLGPKLEEFRDQIDDLSLYEQPEVLPNGDIIIRRKQPIPEIPEGQIDL